MGNRKKKGEKGVALVEVLVSLALLGIIGTGFFSGTMMTTNARVIADEHASAKMLAEGVLDNIKKQAYDASYNVTLPASYAGYSVNVTIEDVGYALQKIIVDISRGGDGLFTLEGYKLQR